MAEGGDRLELGTGKRVAAGGVQETREVRGRILYHQVVVITSAAITYPITQMDGIRRFYLEAHHLNSAAGTHRVYYGDVEVTNGAGNKPGHSLRPGSRSPEIFLANTSKIYVAADNNGDKIILVGTD
jgi:hypothetical protein